MPSLQEQLLKSGLVDKKRAKQVQHQQRQAHTQKKAKLSRGEVIVDEAAIAREQALAEKIAKDRDLNRQQQAVKEAAALQAQITQLVKLNRLDDGQGDVAYQFTDGATVGRVMVTAEQKQALANGQLAIAKRGNTYFVVNGPVADKVCERDESAIVSRHARSTASVQDDSYAEFEIPDDFDW